MVRLWDHIGWRGPFAPPRSRGAGAEAGLSAVDQGRDQKDSRRYLAVVACDRSDLVPRVRRLFLMDENVTVIPDRRVADRRTRAEPRSPDRRRADRRKPPSPEEDLRVHPVIIARRQDPWPALSLWPAGTARSALEGRDVMEDMPRADPQRMARWLEDTREVMGLLPGLVDRLLALERECARLQLEAGRLQQDNDLLRAERREISDALRRAVQAMTEPLNELVQKLRAA